MFGSGVCKVDGVGETVDIDLHRIEGAVGISVEWSGLMG
jgi:hypothetical protein